MWKHQLDLSVDFNLISIDLPSHTKSEYFPRLTLDLYVNVIRELIKTLKIQEVVLCGHSLGGAIAQSYYFKYPKNVAGLILCATGGKLRVNPFILESLKNNFKTYLDSIPAGEFYRKTPKEIINNYIAEASQIKPEVTFQDFSICDKFNTLDKTHTINIPTLIIVGREDKLTPVKYSQYFHDNINDSELVIVEDAGHMVMIEKPEETNRALLDFIRKYFKTA